MRAVVKTAAGNDSLELRDWPEPSPAPNEVKLQVGAAGICGTDIHIIRGTWPCRPPVVLGHEFCGTVVETGAQVRTLKPGDRVVASNPAKTCGACRHCRGGNDFMCPERVSAGYHIDGAFAEYLCIEAPRCHRLPAHVSFRQAALGEPLSVAIHAVIERTAAHSGDVVLVSGPGCVGLLVAQIARLEGAKVIVAGIEKDRRRLACAKHLGADVVVNVAQEDLVEVVRQYTGGEGADLVYECSGTAGSLEACWKAVKKEGTLAPVGIYPGPITTDFNSITMKELRVIGSYGYVWTSWQRCVRLLAEGKVRTEELISHELPLERFAEAFRVTQDGSAIKVVLTP
jgi:L-iditol 2-dehydrogenase